MDAPQHVQGDGKTESMPALNLPPQAAPLLESYNALKRKYDQMATDLKVVSTALSGVNEVSCCRFCSFSFLCVRARMHCSEACEEEGR